MKMTLQRFFPCQVQLLSVCWLVLGLLRHLSISREMGPRSGCGLRASAGDLWNLKVFCGPANCVFYGSIIACQKSLSAGKQMALLQVLL